VPLHSLDCFCAAVLLFIIDVGRESACAADRWVTSFCLFSVCNLQLPRFIPTVNAHAHVEVGSFRYVAETRCSTIHSCQTKYCTSMDPSTFQNKICRRNQRSALFCRGSPGHRPISRNWVFQIADYFHSTEKVQRRGQGGARGAAVTVHSEVGVVAEESLEVVVAREGPISAVAVIA
jgi:hypothetical protein